MEKLTRKLLIDSLVDMYYSKVKELQGIYEDIMKLSGIDITYNELRNKIITGGCYTIGAINDGGLRVNTGVGGVCMYIDYCEEANIPPSVTANSITIHTNEGDFNLIEM